MERLRARSRAGQPLPGADLPWREWLALHFPAVCSRPFGARHERLWEWFEALAPGVRPAPRVEVWPRSGGKSTSTELGCARLCAKLTRRYVLYVSTVQAQADKHVTAIASLLETLGVPRSLNRYGASKGWRREELRTGNGFNVTAYGLDSAARGVKLDHYRPDLIILDDVDCQDDTERTVEKKIASITTAILPAGSADCAVLCVQNLIHEESIFSQLADGRADFLRDRESACVEPAVRGLATELVDRGDGTNVYRITAGEATWAGQDLATCERQINAWGLAAFRREAQHEVAGARGTFFDVDRLQYVDLADVPRDLKRCRGWDLAATHQGGDWTVGALLGILGKFPDVRVYVLDVRRGQWGSHQVRREIQQAAESDGAGTVLRLPQDGGQAGKAQGEQFALQLARFSPTIAPVTGRKAVRARGLAEAVNRGNVFLVKAPWNHPFREVMRKFRDTLDPQQDDDVDAASDAYNELVPPGEMTVDYEAHQSFWTRDRDPLFDDDEFYRP